MRKYPTPSPGEWLHQAVMGALKGRGLSLESWCKTNGVLSQSVRHYTDGLNAGPRSQETLEKLIDDAGREAVLSMYAHRLHQQAKDFERWAA